MLTDTQRDLWEAYLRVENRARREEKLRALSVFLDDLTNSPEEDWHPWARSIAERAVDRADSFTIRMPLFERAVFPALRAGLDAQVHGCARWLSGLLQHVHQCRDCLSQMPEQLRGEIPLLRAALRLDPDDRMATRRLLDAILDGLRFSLHELPAGVLFDMHGATPDQCLALEAELAEFCSLAASEGTEENHRAVIEACRFHFRTYREYLMTRGGEGYGEYLQPRTATEPEA